jgi:hypothetical protein
MSGCLNLLTAVVPTPKLTGRTLSDSATAPNTARAGVQLANSGHLSTFEGFPPEAVTSPDYYPEWSYGGVPSLYEGRLTVNSGTGASLAGSDGAGSWLNLGTTRNWFMGRTVNGSSSGNWTIEIRQVGGPVLASATFDVSVTRS